MVVAGSWSCSNVDRDGREGEGRGGVGVRRRSEAPPLKWGGNVKSSYWKETGR